MIEPISLSDKLLFGTVKIQTESFDGFLGSGTGFFFVYRVDEKKGMPFIITNKHVVKNAQKGSFFLHESIEKEGKKLPSDESFRIDFTDFENFWYFHNDENIDLCIMPILPVITSAENIGKKVYYFPFDDRLVKNNSQLSDLCAIEEVVMVGYPIGLWDEKNNLPILRRGITATHPAIDFQGKSTAVIDIAVFPGSSGSPVLIINEGIFYEKTGATSVGNRIILLGILSSGPQFNAKGEISIVDIPVNQKVMSTTPIMVNLGYYIKANEIINLCKQFIAFLGSKGQLI